MLLIPSNETLNYFYALKNVMNRAYALLVRVESSVAGGRLRGDKEGKAGSVTSRVAVG